MSPARTLESQTTKEHDMNLPSQVHITEVGPRDGLQNEKQQVPAT